MVVFPGENLESKPDQPESAPPVSAFNASLCMHPLFQGWTTGAPAQHSWPDSPPPITRRNPFRPRSVLQPATSRSHSLLEGEKKATRSWLPPVASLMNRVAKLGSQSGSVQYEPAGQPRSVTPIVQFQWPIYLVIWRAGSQRRKSGGVN